MLFTLTAINDVGSWFIMIYKDFKNYLPCLFGVFQNLVIWFYPSLFAWLFFYNFVPNTNTYYYGK
nr:MAG TPA: hypothetical protein [Caudoviricetes sp.]